jgi:hypothetical protein
MTHEDSQFDRWAIRKIKENQTVEEFGYLE